jgi:ketosteroid isomerase-like protein
MSLFETSTGSPPLADTLKSLGFWESFVWKKIHNNMRTIKNLTISIAFTLALSTVAFAQGSNPAIAAPGSSGVTVNEEILRLEREYEQAYKLGAAEKMKRFQTDDFTITIRGRSLTAAEYLEQYTNSNQPRDVIESLTTSDIKVRDYGDTAVTTGRWKRVSKSAVGQDTSAEGFFTRVWVKRNNQWLMAVAHYSPVAKLVN